MKNRPNQYPHIRQLGMAIGIIFAILFIGCDRPHARHSETVLSLTNLVSRMTNISTFAEAPLGQSYLASSYDRRGGNQDWMIFTKADKNGRITLLDLKGPGYISRIWIASFSAKKWLFYFDGEGTPRISLTSKELFGGKFPFVEPLAGKSGGGSYSLLPIPFAKSLRIEVEPKRLNPADRNYFQINYTLLDNSNAISFPESFSAATSNELTSASAPLLNYPNNLKKIASELKSDPQTIKQGDSLTLFESKGAGTIQSIALQLENPSNDSPEIHDALRSLRLQMFWNKSRHPSVDVPLGDFFCNAFYKREFSSLPLANINGTYISTFPMPFQKSAKIQIVNTGSTPVAIRTEICATDDKPSKKTRYFHAKWAASATSGKPFNMGHPKGSGHYVGCLLTAIGQDGSWNILEGDESIIPNSNPAIGQYGTGLEDYFSGAYYYDSLFDLPFHGLIEKGAMRTDQYRFHALDTIAFNDGIDINIEFGDQNRAQGYMSSVIYWYADKPENTTITDDQQRLLARPQDRFELVGMMAQLFTLERATLWNDVAARCRYYAYANRQQQWHSLLELRAEACKAFIPEQQPDYSKFLKSSFPHTAAQARDHIWLESKQTHALLGVHSRGTTKVWIDGQAITETKGADSFAVRQLNLGKGLHTWEVEHEPTHQGSFVSLCLRTAWGDITSEGLWEIVSLTPQPNQKPPDTFKGGQALPNMTVWQFQPNAFPAMQSPTHGIIFWSFWAGQPKIKKIRLRQTWTNGISTKVTMSTEIKRTADEERAHAID